MKRFYSGDFRESEDQINYIKTHQCSCEQIIYELIDIYENEFKACKPNEVDYIEKIFSENEIYRTFCNKMYEDLNLNEYIKLYKDFTKHYFCEITGNGKKNHIDTCIKSNCRHKYFSDLIRCGCILQFKLLVPKSFLRKFNKYRRNYIKMKKLIS
jgi:hypothetical protein